MENFQANINEEFIRPNEERLRAEFAIAWAERERASPAEQAEAESHLNRAVRRLVDFIAYGKHSRRHSR